MHVFVNIFSIEEASIVKVRFKSNRKYKLKKQLTEVRLRLFGLMLQKRNSGMKPNLTTAMPNTIRDPRVVDPKNVIDFKPQQIFDLTAR